MRRLMLLGAVVALTCAPTVVADWEDNFDSYADGTNLHGVGGWKGWDNDPSWTAYVTDDQSRSAPNSVDIIPTADLVHEYFGYTEGEWLYTAWVYVPAAFSGESYFILLNEYADGGGQDLNHWSVQMRFDNDDNIVESEHGGPNLPLIKGQWVRIFVWIDLNADWHTVFYNDVVLEAKPWTAGPNNDGAGIVNIGAVDLYGNNASSVYYDDMSLLPLPAGSDCIADLDGNGFVNVDDLFIVLNDWGCKSGPPCDGDTDGDDDVDVDDLFNVLNGWGQCPSFKGACCFDDGTCDDLTRNGCLVAGGVWFAPIGECADFSCPPPPPNASCNTAYEIEVDGPSITDTTVGMSDAYQKAGCGDAPNVQGPQAWYYVVGDGTILTASICNSGTPGYDGPDPNAWDSAMSVYCGSCDNEKCVAGTTNGCIVDWDTGDEAPEVSFCSVEGEIYWIAVYGDSAGQEGQYELTVTSGADCDFGIECWCPFDCTGTAEGEDCLTNGDVDNPTVDTTNGGCNDCDDPHNYGAIADGETICGTVSTYFSPADLDCDGELDKVGGETTYYGLRDTDWYKMNVPDLGGSGGAEIVITFNAEFDGFAGILPDHCNDPGFLAFIGTSYCEEVTLTIPYLEAGSWICFVASSAGVDVPDCTRNRYSVTVEYFEAQPPVFCNVETPASCQENDITDWELVNADMEGGFQVADDFTFASDTTVNELCWYGAYLFFDGTAWGGCTTSTPGTELARIRYYVDADLNGVPDYDPDNGVLPVAEFTTNANASPNGDFYSTYAGYEFSSTAAEGHPDVVFTGGMCYWVEILNGLTSDSCWVLWASSFADNPAGNNRSLQKAFSDTTNYTYNDERVRDMSFCLGYNGVPVTLDNPAACLGTPPDFDNCQDPAYTLAMFSDLGWSDGTGILRADDFRFSGTKLVDEIHWFGTYGTDGDWATDCNNTADIFNVRIMEDTDLDGCPDTDVLILTNIFPSSKVDTGETWGDTRVIWEFGATFGATPMYPNRCYWLEVVGDDGDSCIFALMNSTDYWGDDTSLVDSDGDGNYSCAGGGIDAENDFGFCFYNGGQPVVMDDPEVCAPVQ